MAERRTRGLGNWGLKIISLLLALLLELYFYSPNNSVTETVPAVIELRNVPPTLIVEDPPEKGIPAQLEISGPSPLVEQVKNTVNKVYVNVPSQAPGEFNLVVDPTQLEPRPPSGVEVRNMQPSTISIRTERVATKKLLVVVNKTGAPAEGFKIEDIEVLPATVDARGPYSRIEGLRAVETQPVDLSGINSSQRREVPLKPQDPLVTLSVTIVTVDVQVGRVEAEKSFDQVAVQVVAPAGFAATVEPSKAAMVVTGAKKEVEKLENENLVLIADATGLTEGKHELALQGVFGGNVRVLKTYPEKVKVILVKKNG